MIKHCIERVLEARRVDEVWEYYVEWKNLPQRYSEWIKEDKIIIKNKRLYDLRIEYYRKKSIDAFKTLSELILKPIEGGIESSSLFRLFGRIKILPSFTNQQPSFTPIQYSFPPPDQKEIPVIIGCSCTNPCSISTNCLCILESESVANYCMKGKLLREENVAIYECNSSCSCGIDCPNRVCQRGSFCNFLIKMTSKGWGLVAMDPIEKGTFIGAYAGKIISIEESTNLPTIIADRRSYLFDLDYYNSSTPTQYTIDAFHYGNHTRFINHSCKPNCRVYPVFTNDGWNPSLHQLAFFFSKDIRRGEEISFDYTGGSRGSGENECKCGESNCKGVF